MVTFIKAQVASITATAIDFSVTIVLVSIFHCHYVMGTAAGTFAGGISYFLIGRRWVFEASAGQIHFQFIKYFFVWIVYLSLSTGGVFTITHYWGLNYIYSKVLVAVTLNLTYNYLLHKKFVFKEPAKFGNPGGSDPA